MLPVKGHVAGLTVDGSSPAMTDTIERFCQEAPALYPRKYPLAIRVKALGGWVGSATAVPGAPCAGRSSPYY